MAFSFGTHLGIAPGRALGEPAPPFVPWDIYDYFPPDFDWDASVPTSLALTGTSIDGITSVGTQTLQLTSTGANRPIYDAANYRMRFGTGLSYLKRAANAAFNNTGSCTCIAVCSRELDTASLEGIFNQFLTTGNQRSFSFGVNSTDNLYSLVSNNGASVVSNSIASVAIQTYDVNILYWRHDVANNQDKLQFNAGFDANTTAAAMKINSTADFGINYVEGAAGAFEGAIHQLVWFNSALSDANLILAQGFYATKWSNLMADKLVDITP